MQITSTRIKDQIVINVGVMVSVTIDRTAGPGDFVEVLYQASPNSDWWYDAKFPLPDWYNWFLDDEGLEQLGREAREFLFEKGYKTRPVRRSRRETDSQRQRVYNAEKVIRDSANDIKFDSLAEMQQYVNEVTSSRFVLERFPSIASVGQSIDVKTKIQMRGNHAHATREKGRKVIGVPAIEKGRWAYSANVALHEIAHHVVPWSGVASHGHEFCATYLALVRRFMGKEAAQTLAESFRAHKVRYRPKRTREITEEQREALRERLVKARAAKAAKKELVA